MFLSTPVVSVNELTANVDLQFTDVCIIIGCARKLEAIAFSQLHQKGTCLVLPLNASIVKFKPPDRCWPISDWWGHTSSVSSVSVAEVDLQVAEEIKVLGVVLNQRLTFRKHVSAVARSCNCHAQAIRHIRHLLTSTDLAQTLACSLTLSLIDYCNAVLPRRSNLYHPEVAACAEQRSSDHPPWRQNDPTPRRC